jgi:chromosome segregation ATPase
LDNKQRIELAKVNLQKADRAQAQAETEEKTAKEQREELVGKLKELKVTPETAPKEISDLDQSISERLTKVEGLIPKVGA